jgi:hypothetical protein
MCVTLFKFVYVYVGMIVYGIVQVLLYRSFLVMYIYKCVWQYLNLYGCCVLIKAHMCWCECMFMIVHMSVNECLCVSHVGMSCHLTLYIFILCVSLFMNRSLYLDLLYQCMCVFSVCVYEFKKIVFETRSCYVAQTGLKLVILLPQPPKLLGLQICATILG